MTATTLPRTDVDTRLTEVDRQLEQLHAAITSGVHGWAEQVQDHMRRLKAEKADLLGELGRFDERHDLLTELALGA